MNKIVFVTRATQESGKGHFFRVVRMIKSLYKNYNCTLVVDKDAIAGNERFKCHPFDENHPERLVRELDLSSGDLIWFDIPDLQYQILKRFTGLGIPLVSTNMFEKIGEERYEDLAVYPVFERYKKSLVGGKTLQLSGSDLISIPEEFFSKGESKYPQVLVSMGGTDPMDFTPLVLKAISKIGPSKYKFKVILPKGSSDEKILNEYKSCSHIELYEFGSIDFAKTLKSSEYAIINGGMTRYECIAAKTFFVALSIHDLQASLSEKVTKYGLGENFGVFNEKEIKRLSLLLSSLPLSPGNAQFDDEIPVLIENGAEWIYEQVVRELENENE